MTWNAIVNKYGDSIGKKYLWNNNDSEWEFWGIVHAQYDYYYMMINDSGETHFLSCVGDISDHGFTYLETNKKED